MNSGNGEEPLSAAAARWGWDTRLKAGLYPEDMGSAIMKRLLAEVWRGSSAEGRLHSGLGEMREGLLHPGSDFVSPPATKTVPCPSSHTHKLTHTCIHLFIHSFNQQLFMERLPYGSHYFRHRGHTEAKILALTELIF